MVLQEMKVVFTISFQGRGNLFVDKTLEGDLNDGKNVVVKIPKINIIAGNTVSLNITERFLLQFDILLKITAKIKFLKDLSISF